MKLVLLAGNSIHNKAWIKQVEREMRPLFSSTLIHEYEHWKNGSGMIDLDLELKVLSHELRKEKKYVLFARAIGAILCLKGIKERKIYPAKCMFCEIPAIESNDNNAILEKYLEAYALQTVFIQNKHDPSLSAHDLKELLKAQEVKKKKVITFEGEDNNYPDIIKLKKIMKKLLRKKQNH